MGPELPLADELAAVYARMTGLLLSEETVTTALTLVTSLAKETFAQSDGVGVSLLDEHGAPKTTAATGEVVQEADRLQYEIGQGPCLTAWADQTVVRVDDAATDDRWPDWAALTPMRSVLSAPMVAGGDGLGALKVYARQPHVYGPREEHLLSMFAASAAVLVANVRSFQDARRVSEELKSAIRERDVINMAKGVIMARDETDEQAAFMLLAGMANEQHRPLRDVADELTRSAARHGG